MSENSESARSENEAYIREVGEVREEWMSIREAADRLGLSVRAVQLQAQDGRIRKRREGKRLFVCLSRSVERETGEETRSEAPAQFGETGEGNEAKTQVRENSHWRSEAEYLRRTLQDTLQRHGQEIERRDVAESELRRLLLADREEIRRLRAITAIPEAPAVETDEADDTPEEERNDVLTISKPAPVTETPSQPAQDDRSEDLGENTLQNAAERKRGFFEQVWDVLLFRNR